MKRLYERAPLRLHRQRLRPGREKSTPTTLFLVNGYDQKPSEETPAKEAKPSATKEPPAELTENDIYRDVIEYNEPAKKLTDTRYTAEGTAQTNGEYKWRATPYSTYVALERLPRRRRRRKVRLQVLRLQHDVELEHRGSGVDLEGKIAR